MSNDIVDRLNIKRSPTIVESREAKLNELALGQFFVDIIKERKYQDDKWGGPDFDDTQSEEQWIEHIKEYADGKSERSAKHSFQTRMTKVAALAAAAVQAEKRRVRRIG